MPRSSLRLLAAFFSSLPLVLGTSLSATPPPNVPGEAWADEQRERALATLSNRDVERAQSLFDEGWNPFFGFAPVQIFAGQVAAFDWASRSWRRASLSSYLEGSPNWKRMFSLSAIPSQDGAYTPRPWANLQCQNGFEGRCVIAVTKGGFDKVRWLEVDATTGSIPDTPFDLPVARSSFAWLDRDTAIVAIGRSEADTASSGYPLTVRLLKRGADLDQAPIIYRAGEHVDQVGVFAAGNAGNGYASIVATVGTRTVDARFVDATGTVSARATAVDADPLGVMDDTALLTLLEDWKHDAASGQTVWQAGSIVAVDLKGQAGPRQILDPFNGRWASVSATSQGALFTLKSVFLSVLEEGVRSVFRASPDSGGWTLSRSLGDGRSVASLVSSDPAGDTLLASLETSLAPPKLIEFRGGRRTQFIRESRKFFSDKGIEIERFEAVGADGVAIPYWRVGPPNTANARPVATILHGYGASNVPLLPEYAADVGRMWLELGGAYIYAQVRGGGEYGANWYNAGHGANRAVPLKDFLSVAVDIVDRGIASPNSLGLDGTSDGGRLVTGAALVRPDLFAAVVSRDGSVFPEAASEEGSPVLAEDMARLRTPEGRAIADQYWPDRLLDAQMGCAPILFTSWRGDQRVPASQSRSLAHMLQSQGCDALLIERLGGDHGSSDAELIASVYAYFSDRLGLGSRDVGPE